MAYAEPKSPHQFLPHFPNLLSCFDELNVSCLLCLLIGSLLFLCFGKRKLISSPSASTGLLPLLFHAVCQYAPTGQCKAYISFPYFLFRLMLHKAKIRKLRAPWLGSTRDSEIRSLTTNPRGSKMILFAR